VTPPVIAAGGIADASSVAHALGRGRNGRLGRPHDFVASAESAAHPYYKQRIVDAASSDAVYTMAFDGGWEKRRRIVPLRNSSMDMFDRGEKLRANVVATFPNGEPIRRFDDTPPIVGITGDLEALALYAGGKAAARFTRFLPAADIVRELSGPFRD